jgi:predicted DNA-binding transcriptional regulator AlpA
MVTEQQNALTPRQAAKYVGVSEAALRLWRTRGEGPRHFRAGEKLIRYRRADLDSWIESRLSERISPVGGAGSPMTTQRVVSPAPQAGTLER